MDLIKLEATDFGPFEHIELPLAHQGLVWVGGENRDTKAAKSNGSGKTSLFRALTWGLWGCTIDGEKGDKVIRKGSKRATVVVHMEGGWKVDRSRAKGSPRLQLIQPDGKPFKVSTGDLQDKIDEMVGLDFQSFKNTVLYGQNDSARFANPNTKDNDRKDMLHKIMRTGLLQECHKHVMEQARGLKSEIADIEGELAAIQARIDEHDIEGLAEFHKEWEQDRVGKIAQYKLQAKEYKQQALDAMEDAMDEEAIAALQSKVAELKKVAEQSDKSAKLADAADEKIDNLGDELNKLNRTKAGLEARVEQFDEQVAMLEGDKCPVCSTPASGEHFKRHRKDLEKQRAAIQADMEQVEQQSTELEAQQEKLTKTLKKHKDKVKEGRLALREINELEGEIAEAQSAQGQADHFVELARQQLAEAKRVRDEDNPYTEQLESAREKVKTHTEARKDWRRQLKEKQDELGHVQFWVRGFSGQGLPSFILDSVMPFITERANHYLDTLADGDIQMRFDTQSEMKSSKGEYRDKINIAWTIEGIDDSYPPSGGQLKKMEVATDLGLMDLVATREGAQVDLLALDEILDGLDEEGRQRVLQLLHEMRIKRGTIFVISHETDIAEIFEKAVTVVKEGGVSRLEVSM